MTLDMAFECVLVSRDPNVVCTLNRALGNLSISTKICLSASKALDELKIGSTDLIVIDWEEDSATSELIADIQKSDIPRKKTVVSVASPDHVCSGANAILTKPVTAESTNSCLKSVYNRLIRDYRRHARYVIMTPVIATVNQGRLLPITVSNIGDGGVGLTTRESVDMGDVLSFRLPLPHARRPIFIEARVLWVREYGACGCEFMRIPPVDLDILHDWLKAKCQIKKPLLPL